MNRQQRRAYLTHARQHVRTVNKAHGDDFEPVPRERWPASAPPGLTGVARNRNYLVQIYADTFPGVTRLSICRTAINNTGQWQANITWEELQAVKRGVGFGDYDAVEVYPRDADVVNVANMRHLWVSDEPLGFVWRNGEAQT